MKKCIAKNKTKFITVVMISAFLFLLWVGRVIYINVTEPDTVYKYFELGEMCEYKGVGITCVGFEIISDEDFADKYEIDKQFIERMRAVDIEYVIYVAHLKYTRIGKGEGPSIYSDTLVSTAMSSVSLMPTLEDSGFDYYERHQKVIDELEIGESVEVWRAFGFHHEENKDFYYNLDKYPLYIQYPDYEGSEYIRMLKVNDMSDS